MFSLRRSVRYIGTLSEVRDNIVTLSEVRDNIGTRSELRDNIGTRSEVRDNIGTCSEVRDNIGTCSELRPRIYLFHECGYWLCTLANVTLIFFVIIITYLDVGRFVVADVLYYQGV